MFFLLDSKLIKGKDLFNSSLSLSDETFFMQYTQIFFDCGLQERPLDLESEKLLCIFV